ncbi:MAG: ABC transporter permease [Bacteroidales bacterium]|jgi:putative ABC transport system permease protein|nr:ABC transporter permease [Bacteroidales bacterium]
MKTIFKNFIHLLSKFRTSSIFNILGLSVALVVFFIVLMQVHYDFTFDRGYTNSNKIFQFNRYYLEDGEEETSTNINFQIPEFLKESFPEIENYCMLSNWGSSEFDILKEDDFVETYNIPFIRSTPGFWKVFSPEIIYGDTTAIFSAPGRAMISEKTAEKLFGEENALGKTIDFHYSSSPMTVQAVYRDFPENSSIGNGLYTYLQKYDETEWSFHAYFLINPQNITFVREKINSAEIISEETFNYLKENPDIILENRLSCLNELYLDDSGMGGSKRINTTITLLVIGILTLFVAFVNFINLSLAMSPSRVRRINIHKVLGINKLKLRFTISLESVFLTIISLILAFLGISFLKDTSFAQGIFSTNLSLWQHSGLLLAAMAIILIIALLIGLYTSKYTISFDVSEALKGSFSLGIKGKRLRNVLIVIQFTTAIALICISTFIKLQHNHMLNHDWGIPKENVVYMPLYGLGQNAEAFGQELLRNPNIKDYCITRDLPGGVGMSWGREFEGKDISLFVWSVDDRFFDFFEVDIIEGRKPEHMDSVVSQIVLNETFLKKYEFDAELVGKDFPAFGPGRVQAIAKDVNFQSLHVPITPMAFGVLSQWNNFSYFLVKLSGNNLREEIAYIEQTWNQFSKEPFEVRFLDENMDNLYKQENNMAKLIGIFGFIIVIIAIMGVYGLILFNTKYKEKEIAIRKVNGSTEKEIIFMLNRSIVLQLIIAFILAIPIVYFFVDKWLNNFAYKISISWWVFLLGGLVIFIITLATVTIQSYKAAVMNPVKSLNKE